MDKRIALIFATALLAISGIFIFIKNTTEPVPDYLKAINSKLPNLEDSISILMQQDTVTAMVDSTESINQTNPEGTRLALHALVTLNNDEARRYEYICLADSYPDDELVQVIALNSCDFTLGCDYQRFAQRLLKINPKNGMAKAMLASFSIEQGDDPTALEILETISTQDDYPSYFNDFAKAAYIEINTSDLLEKFQHGYPDFRKPEHNEYSFEVAMGISAAQIEKFKTYAYCIKKIKEDKRDKRWNDACEKLGENKEKSESSMNIIFGLSLQKQSLESRPITSELEKKLEKINQKMEAVRNIPRINGQILNPENPDYETELALYKDDFFKYGELIATKNLALRYKIKRDTKPQSPPQTSAP